MNNLVSTAVLVVVVEDCIPGSLKGLVVARRRRREEERGLVAAVYRVRWSGSAAPSPTATFGLI